MCIVSRMRCVVTTCENSSQITPDITFFKFTTNPSLRAIWLGALQQDCKLEEDSAVCSEHFLMNDLLKTSNGKLLLRVGAVPVLKKVLEDHLTEPSDVKVCRVCLETEGEMCKMEENDMLCKVYQILTGLTLSEELRLPCSVCPECCSWMLECERFKNTSLRSHLVLQQILNRYGCITVESINKFHSPVSLDTTDKQTGQCHSHNEAVIKDQDAQTDRQTETVLSNDVDEYIKTEDIKIENDNMMNLDIIKDECDIDDTDKVTDDNDDTENSVVDNVLDLQETADDPLKIENECKSEADVNKQSDNDEMEHGTVFSDEDLSLRELSEMKTSQDYNHKNNDTRRKQRKYLMTHSGEIPHACDICQKRFSKKSNLKRHLITHSRERSYACDICQQRFPLKSHFKEHLLIHSGEKPYACDICQKRFSQKSHFKQHLLIHSGERPHACDICQKRFAQNANLKKHLLIHSGEKPHACNICQKRFSQKTNLKKHLLIHSGEKPYACDICQKRFSQRSHFKEHLVIHSGERPTLM